MQDDNTVLTERAPPKYKIIDIIEQYGLSATWHIATAVQHLLWSGMKAPAEAVHDLAIAKNFLQRWLDSEAATFNELIDFDDTIPLPADVVQAFGLQGNVAIAITHLLTWAMEEDESETSIEKALQALRMEDES